MSDINVDLIEHFKYFMSCIDNESNEFTKAFNEKTLYIDFFNEFIYCTAIGLDTDATKENSPMYVFNLLNVRPDRTLKEFKEKYLFYDSIGYLEITKKDLKMMNNKFIQFFRFIMLNLKILKAVDVSKRS